MFLYLIVDSMFYSIVADTDADTPKSSVSLCFLIVVSPSARFCLSNTCSSAFQPICLPIMQDDSSINVKVLTRLIESEKEGVFANAVILTADDGTTAIETLQQQTSAGRQVHFVLMDSVMVAPPSTLSQYDISFYPPLSMGP